MTTPAEEVAARIEAATAIRRLSHSLMAHRPDTATLAQITASATALADDLESHEQRFHPFKATADFSMPKPLKVKAGELEKPKQLFADSVVSGKANPMGMDASLWTDGDEAVMEVVLGPAFEGAPDRAHGGVMAALIDELMGQVLGIIGTPAFTGRLTVTYRNPTPLGVPLIGRARATEWKGRKISMTAEVHAGETLIAESEALFISVDPERFIIGAPSA
jgi:acyl-coenzyme A thioesterase PaaI-like protein